MHANRNGPPSRISCLVSPCLILQAMSWEAYRWTAKTPSELYHTLGPHGVDELVRKVLSTCWRNLPAEGRTLEAAQAMARQVLARNIAVWSKIKKPTPEAFFADLAPHETDGYMRQAMVTCWMMMPRAGGREVPEALRIVREVFERNMAAWEQDNQTFTGSGKKKKPTRPPKATKKAAPKKKGKKR
jgi:hypothetical protein